MPDRNVPHLVGDPRDPGRSSGRGHQIGRGHQNRRREILPVDREVDVTLDDRTA